VVPSHKTCNSMVQNLSQNSCKAVFTSRREKFRDTVAFLFVYDNYYLTMD
jgi:hypothetical protein